MLSSAYSAADSLLMKNENPDGKLHSEDGNWSLMVPALKDIDRVVLDEMIAESGDDLSYLEEGDDKEAARVAFIAGIVQDMPGQEGQVYQGDALIQWHCNGQLVAEIDENGEFVLHDFDAEGEFFVRMDDESFVARDGKFQR